MASKGILWIWLSLLALRGLAVFCFYINYQHGNVDHQSEVYLKETPAYNLPSHSYKFNKVHTAGISFFVLS